MKTYRVAILGCRGRGTAGGLAYHAHPRTEVVGLCDLIPERLETLGGLLSVSERFSDFSRMIEETQPDIVTVPTGTEFHYPLCMGVLDHEGVHIDVEKPICVDLNQADQLLEKAGKKGAKIAVHHQGRSGTCLKAVVKAFQDGKIGQLRHIEASGKGYYGGYGLMNIGTHTINAMLALTGHCRRVSASLLTNGHPVTPEDVVPSPSGMGIIAGEHITATLEFDRNVTATITQHRFPTVDSTAHGFVAYGTEGRLLWHNRAVWWLPVPHFLPGSEGAEWEALEQVIPDHFEPDGRASLDDYLYADDYVSALDEGCAHPSSGEEGRHVLEVLMAIFESGAHQKPVVLPQKERDHPLLRWRKEAGLGDPVEMPRPVGEWLAAEGKRLGWEPEAAEHKVHRI